MKRLLLTTLLVFFASILFAQQNHFIYLQTDNQQPFYVKLDRKILSSSTTGYLIIPKLKDGDYTLVIGFPKDQWPEQTVKLTINKNTGFQLKNFGEKGWGLFNLQSFEIIMAESAPSKSSSDSLEKKTDVFIDMLSDVVSDPSIKYIDSTKNDSLSLAIDLNEFNTAQTTDTTSIIAYTHIEKQLENADKFGLERVYTDQSGDQKDTIRVFIPSGFTDSTSDSTKNNVAMDSSKNIISDSSNNNLTTNDSLYIPHPDSLVVTHTDSTIVNPVMNDTLTITKDKLTDSSKVSDSSRISDTTAIKVPPQTDTTTIKTSGLPNTDCKAFASDEDFLKLRKKMAGENNDEDMINVARKYFKSKCFTTEYIKHLGALFLKDQGRYTFFDAAYPFVTDAQNFPTLEKELTDEYYLNRFRAMIKK
jgi:hypothetical protein